MNSDHSSDHADAQHEFNNGFDEGLAKRQTDEMLAKRDATKKTGKSLDEAATLDFFKVQRPTTPSEFMNLPSPVTETKAFEIKPSAWNKHEEQFRHLPELFSTTTPNGGFVRVYWNRTRGVYEVIERVGSNGDIKIIREFNDDKPDVDKSASQYAANYAKSVK